MAVVLLSAVVSSVATASAAESARSSANGAVAGDPVDSGSTTAAAVGGGPTAAAVSDDIRLTQRLSLTPERRGEVEVTLRFEVPDRVVSLTTQIPASATVTATSGFSATNDTHYEYDGDSDVATVTLRYPVNETVSTTGPGYAVHGLADEWAGRQASRDARADRPSRNAQTDTRTGLVFADVGEWALVSRPSVSVGWSYRGETVGLSRSVEPVGEGAAGERIVFLGDHRTVTRSANGQTFEFVIPAAASLRESPDDVLDAMATSSKTLAVGDTDDRVFMVAAPDDRVDWAVRGLETGSADFWVEASESLNRTNSAWIHEYVHTRQDYRTRVELRWFTEGSATYYATLLGLRAERITFEEFRAFLAVGRTQYGDAVLADPSNWQGNGNYYKGALVLGELDRRIRLASDRSATMGTVFRALNADSGRVGQAEWLEAVLAAGNATTRDWAATYTETDAVPPVWSREQHNEAFGDLPARLVYGFASPDALTVRGPYRTTTVSADEPLTVVPGERLTVRTRVENTGGTEGSYNASLWLDDRLLAAPTGTVGGGETASFETEYAPASNGAHTLRIGTETVALRVVEPATPAVTHVAVDRTTLPQAGTVGVTATVTNDASIPANGTVAFTVDGEVVRRQVVRLAPNANETVSTEVRLSEPGTYAVGVADGQTRQVTVETTPTSTVTSDGATETGDGQTAGDSGTATFGPGFGVVATLLAVVGAVVLAGMRR